MNHPSRRGCSCQNESIVSITCYRLARDVLCTPTQLGERMLAGSDWHDTDLVFAQPNGWPID
jgi:hypothetical protein